MTARDAYISAARELTLAGIDSPQSEAWQLLEAATGKSKLELHTTNPTLSPEQQRRLGEWLVRRRLREPLQLILGRTDFYGLNLEVVPGVLIPRPETERLVELALALLQPHRAPLVIDVGTGSGAVAIALARERRDARVIASDNSATALALAARNARLNEVEVELFESDLLAAPRLREEVRRARLIVSNPPYLPEGDLATLPPEVTWEPGFALFAGADGLAVFRRLLSEAHQLLAPGATLLVELDPRNVAEAAVLAREWSKSRIDQDLTGRDRFLELVR